MIFVFGSGFGLYGHTAALASANYEVATLSQYRSIAEARLEMLPLIDRIQWVDESEVSRAQTIALVRRPSDNQAMARKLVCDAAATVVIEKPIARSWAEASSLAKFLNDSRRTWTVPYLFLYCDWFAPLQAAFGAGARVFVKWTHLKSPHNAAWKNNSEEGGGEIAFYAIHACAIMALLADDGRNVKSCVTRTTRGVCARLSLEEIGSLSVEFTEADSSRFLIEVDGARLFEAPSPFGAVGKRGTPDPRIKPLLRFYESLSASASKARMPVFHDTVHRIWRDLDRSVAASL